MLLAASLALTLVTVPLAGGRLSRLAELRLRHGWAMFVALGAQVLIVSVVPEGPERLYEAIHLGSYLLAAYFFIVNRRIPFLWLLALGALFNFLAIAANGGVMPASRDALESAGLLTDVDHFTNSGVVEDPKLLFLGDVFAVPAPLPIANVFSIGDVCMALGAFLLVHAVTGSRLVHHPTGRRARMAARRMRAAISRR